MSTEEQAQFLQQLAEDLNSKNIKLPSFPDVVINIRTALEDPQCSSERLADVVRTDAVLVARLLVGANSAFHNRAGIEITDLALAISRLGFEVVRNMAITLAVEQIFNASQHDALKSSIKDIWSSSLSLASMCFVIARNSETVNPDNAFLCGLLHQIGKLYILTKAQDYPNFLGDAESLSSVLDEWYASVGKLIVESWGFPDEIANSVEYEDHLIREGNASASMIDVIYAAQLILQQDDQDDPLAESTDDIIARLRLTTDSWPSVREAYDLHSQSMRQSVG
ncbi:MAG: HDOD domain-containing protein [Woeseiaceae bacterium]|nr:HDOD domain-containing protein [Woeseiaceae bacterium]